MLNVLVLVSEIFIKIFRKELIHVKAAKENKIQSNKHLFK